ncbi:MAG: N-acetylmuramic acid 6-phosphate etherase [Anaerolineae bacterium]
MDLDRMTSLEIVQAMHRQDLRAMEAVGGALTLIAGAADRVAERMGRGGRLIYVGAGSAGRAAMLDAIECPPTFGVAPTLVVALVAGGNAAMVGAVEGAEDDAEAGRQAIADAGVTEVDSVVGVAASGSTPYTVAAVEAARARGAFTVGLANNHPSPLTEAAAWPIPIVVGPEALTGSTRLSAGTAQKVALNMLSTAVMVRLGHVYSNLMVGVRATNVKLHGRAVRIVREATGADEATARAWLEAAGWHVKTAVVMGLAGLDADAARARLEATGGFVRRAVEG